MTNFDELKFKQIEKAVKKGDLIAIGSLGQRIKDIREALGMTQSQLAKRAKIKQPALSRLEENISKSSLSTVIKIINALGCTFMGAIITTENDLRKIVEQQAEKVAGKILERISANMAMEEQAATKSAYNFQLKELIADFVANPGPELWED